MLRRGGAHPGHRSDWVPCKEAGCVERTESPALPAPEKQTDPQPCSVENSAHLQPQPPISPHTAANQNGCWDVLEVGFRRPNGAGMSQGRGWGGSASEAGHLPTSEVDIQCISSRDSWMPSWVHPGGSCHPPPLRAQPPSPSATVAASLTPAHTQLSAL